MNTFKDVDFLQIVPDTYGIGIEFLRKGEKYVSVCEHEKSRKVFLDITTWKSMQSDALHYYGELKVNGIRAQCLKTSKLFYIEGSDPLPAQAFKIQLTRPLRKKDLMIDRGERFRGAVLGERIKNFDSISEVENAGMEFFSKFFVGNWQLVRLVPDKNSILNGVAMKNDEKTLSTLVPVAG